MVKMRDDGYCFKHLNVLLSLLENEVKGGSLSEIMKKCGYKSNDGSFYKIRDWLIKEDILIENGNSRIRCGFGEKIVHNYKINKNVIYSILFAEWETRIIYKHTIQMKTGFWREIKPRMGRVIHKL